MTEQKKLTPSGEWSTLAGLRFVLALGVLLGHIYMMFPAPFVSMMTSIGGPSPFVLGFFVVSGYSIAASVERHSDYYKRRAIRILPVYYICLAIALAAMYTWPQHAHHLPKKMLLVNILLLQGYYKIPPFFGFGQSWSLVCEVAYYVLAPALNRLKAPWLLAITALSVAGYSYTFGHPIRIPFLPSAEAAALLAWAWLMGFIYYKHRTRRWAQLLLFIGFPLVGSISYHLFGIANILGRIVVLTAAAVAVGIAYRLRVNPVVAKVSTYLGDVSYPLYLVHIPVLLAMQLNHVPLNWMSAGVIALTAAMAINAIDQPIQRRRKSTFALRGDTALVSEETVLAAR